MKTELFEQLTKLADELDIAGHNKQTDDVDQLINDMAKVMDELNVRRKQEITDLDTEKLVKCPKCEGLGYNADEPWCSACKGDGFFAIGKNNNEALVKSAVIKKRKGEYCVMSKKGKSLGCYKSRKEALKRLRQVEFFKHNK